MYEVEEYRWIQIASMSFIDAVARWFQFVETKLRHASWQDFVMALLDRFGREQKELLIRQLFHIKQTRTIVEYVDKFAEHVDQLTAYGHVTELVYYAMRFVDGLREDIRAAVSLHRPPTFDTAASLALLQDDLGSRSRASRKHDHAFGSKISPRGAHPLPPHPRIDKSQLLYYLKRRSSVKENHLKRRWPRRGLIKEQKDFVFVVLKGGIVNTNALRQSNVMLFKSCWSFSIWNISTHCLCLLKCRSSYLWLFLRKLLLARRVLAL